MEAVAAASCACAAHTKDTGEGLPWAGAGGATGRVDADAPLPPLRRLLRLGGTGAVIAAMATVAAAIADVETSAAAAEMA
jgi:hypothetical protein